MNSEMAGAIWKKSDSCGGRLLGKCIKAKRGGGVHCQFREMEHAIEEFTGAGKAMSRHDAGSDTVERKTRSSERHGGQDQVAEQSQNKSKGALLFEQEMHMLIRYQSERGIKRECCKDREVRECQ